MKAELHLYRYVYNIEGDRNIIGDLFLNGEYFCHTLEDELRAKGVKVKHKTAIDAGTYEVKITRSNRFKRDMPLLINVPRFEGIRIHGGNTSANTSGCILVAFNTDHKKIWGTAEHKLTKKLKQFDEIEIIIDNTPLTYNPDEKSIL